MGGAALIVNFMLVIALILSLGLGSNLGKSEQVAIQILDGAFAEKQDRSWAENRASPGVSDSIKSNVVGEKKMTSLEEIRRIKAEIEPELLIRPEVVGVDIGHQHVEGQKIDRLAIRIYVKHQRDGSEPPFPNQIQGVPVEVIERNITLH